MNKTILYIGNDLIKKTKYTTTMDTLSYLLSVFNRVQTFIESKTGCFLFVLFYPFVFV